MGNRFTKRKSGELAAMAAAAGEGLARTYEAYGIDAASVERLFAAEEAMRRAMNEAFHAIVAARAAVATKRTCEAALAGEMSALAARIEANPAVDDAMLLALGFAPRPKPSGRMRPPITPEGLRVLPNVHGTVRLRWERGENGVKTMFLIETRTDDGPWLVVHSTMRIGATLDGFPPGTAAWFRVSASNSIQRSTPTAPVGIYGAGTTRSELRAA